VWFTLHRIEREPAAVPGVAANLYGDASPEVPAHWRGILQSDRRPRNKRGSRR